MNILKATKRTSASTGQVNKLRSEGFIPGVLYGGKKNNLNISLKKLHLQNIINTETFMSKVYDLDIDGNSEKALARDISYDPVSDEPIHIDFMRITKGSQITLEIPVKFINSDKSPGLKKGGVLNIVRRKVELKCQTENIPNEIIVDLDNTEINTSLNERIDIFTNQVGSKENLEKAEKIYKELKKQNIDVLLDDVDENMSNKFKKHDLIGVPFQIIIGSKSGQDSFEFKELNSKSAMLNLEDIKSQLKKR